MYSSYLGCDCNDLGSNSTSCHTNGQCFCKANIVGYKCTECKSGYHGFPDCTGKTK